ncbi:hypothetical protein FTX61_00665 [Nitriliruptoraceae bacterium ZYF776]|nr:hypothetical protein [Profundirhabdus halotolerans]
MTVRGADAAPVVVASGETVVVGRAPEAALLERGADAQLRTTALPLAGCSPHVSRLLGELLVGDEIVRLRWHGAAEAQLSSLFDAPGGARRVTLAPGMTAMLDEGENQVLVLRGRSTADGGYRDLVLVVDVDQDAEEPAFAPGPPPGAPLEEDRDASVTAPAPQLEVDSREWYVALALAEPWLTGADDYPRPASNREIYERILGWHGYAWNLQRPQRVDEAIRAVSRLAFGPADDPFAAPTGRAQNVRFAVGRRAAEVRLVTAEQLVAVERRAADRRAAEGGATA